jgi:quinol monooxygenase YgiN
MIIVAGTATIKADKLDEAMQKAQHMAELTEAEAGCISYRIYVHPVEQTTFFIFEEWDSPEALTRHFQTEHLQAFSAYLATILAGPMQIKRYEVGAVTPL